MAESHSNPLYALCVLLNHYINSSGLLHPQISWTVTQWVTLMVQGFSKSKCFVWLFLTALVPEEIFALALSPLPLECLLHCFLSLPLSTNKTKLSQEKKNKIKKTCIRFFPTCHSLQKTRIWSIHIWHWME